MREKKINSKDWAIVIRSRWEPLVYKKLQLREQKYYELMENVTLLHYTCRFMKEKEKNKNNKNNKKTNKKKKKKKKEKKENNKNKNKKKQE